MPTRRRAAVRLGMVAVVAALAIGVAVPAVLAASRGVTIQDFAFSPRTIEIRVGDTVTWTNRDGVAHTATAQNGSFDTGLLAEGESGSIRFTAPGTYRYLCSPHPEMTGTVVVRAAGTVVPPITATETVIDTAPEPTADPPIGPLAAVGGLAIVLAERLLRRRRPSA